MIRLFAFLVAILFAASAPLRADMVYVSQYFSNDPIVTVNTANPSTPIFFASVPNNPVFMAFDSSGNLYVSQQTGTTVDKITPGGVVSTFATGLNGPTGLAFDTSGNLYVSNYGNGSGTTVSKITPGGVVSTFATGLNGPEGLAFDSKGNLYAGNLGNGDSGTTVSKITPSGSVSTFATGLSAPVGMAFDSKGNLYVANYNNGTVSEITPGGVESIFCSNPSDPDPQGLAFDSQGNLYVCWGAGQLKEYNSSGTLVQTFTGFDNASGIAFAAVPEPSSMILLGLTFAVIGFGAWMRRRRQQIAATVA
jgi:sugar lactone lactonase YvrE